MEDEVQRKIMATSIHAGTTYDGAEEPLDCLLCPDKINGIDSVLSTIERLILQPQTWDSAF